MLLEALITKGQVLFFIIAMGCFGVLMIYLYRQDRRRDASYFKGTGFIFLTIVLIMSLLFLYVKSQS